MGKKGLGDAPGAWGKVVVGHWVGESSGFGYHGMANGWWGTSSWSIGIWKLGCQNMLQTMLHSIHCAYLVCIGWNPSKSMPSKQNVQPHEFYSCFEEKQIALNQVKTTSNNTSTIILPWSYLWPHHICRSLPQDIQMGIC